MTLSKSSRRLTAIVASVLLLGCQSVAVAHARTLPATPPGANATLESCQEYGHGPDGGGGNYGYQTRCQSQNASPPPQVEMNALAAVVSPAIAGGSHCFAIDPGTVRPTGAWLTHVESPPLRILLCRLRN